MTPLRLVAYINGARIFPSAVTATFDVGAYAQFSVNVPAIPDWTELPVRSVVSIFYTDPVDNAWRLLVDGEYVGRARAKTSAGTRSLQLLCRGHLAWTTSQTFASVGGAVLSGDADKTGVLQSLVANGFMYTDKPASVSVPLQTIPQFFANAATKSSDITQLFRRLLRSIAYQSPVDAYYYKFRHLFDMFGSVPDLAIQRAFTNNRFLGLMKEWNDKVLAPDQNAAVESLLLKYLDMAFYRHTPIPSPPAVTRVSDGVPQIKSQFLIPALYETVPPACNIIFADQVVSDSESINWLAVPSRVTTRLSMGMLNQATPIFYVASDATRAVNLTENPGTAIVMLHSHGVFSQDELTRGVRNVFTDVRLETAEQNGKPDLELAAYLDSMARYNYSKLRGEALRRSLQCQFMPYLMPGFTCVLEDHEGSFYGYLESVTHSIDHTGVAATTVSLTHVRDLRVRPGNNKNGPLPVWLNDQFKPDLVDLTYGNYFGVASPLGATSGFSVPVTGAHEDSVDPTVFKMDDFLAKIVSVPRFNAAGILEDPVATITKADELRAFGSPAEVHRAMQQWQYRQGTSLEDYAAAYGLDTPALAGIEDPPLDLSNGKDVPAFGTPNGMRVDGASVNESKGSAVAADWYAAQDTDPSRAGIFNLEPTEQAAAANTSPERLFTQSSLQDLFGSAQGLRGLKFYQSERQYIARLLADRLAGYSIERMASPGSQVPLAHRPVLP